MEIFERAFTLFWRYPRTELHAAEDDGTKPLSLQDLAAEVNDGDDTVNSGRLR